MRLLTRDSNLYLIMVMLNCFASKASAMINGDIGFSMHSGGKLNIGLLSSFSEPLQCQLVLIQIVKRCTIKLCTTKKSVTIGCLDMKNVSKLRITTPNSTSWNRRYLILQYMSVWNSPKATHIYTVSITYFVLKFLRDFIRHVVLSM